MRAGNSALMGQPKPLDLVNAFFAHFSPDFNDEAVLDYVTDSLLNADPSDLDQALSDLLDLCASAAPGFRALTEAELTPRLLALHEDCIQAHKVHSQPALRALSGSLPASASVSAGGAAPSGGGAATCSFCTDGTDGMEACMAALCVGQQREQHQPGTSSSEQSDDERSPDVATLAELCPPGMHPGFLASLINSCGGLQQAVEWVLEEGPGPVARREAMWLAAHEQASSEAAEAAQLQRELKKKIVDKFDLQALKLVPAGTKYVERKEIKAHGSDKAAPAAKVRYRDGQPVSFKGEKFILEKVGEEWDGGSRGKVYTKGKRGKGFH